MGPAAGLPAVHPDGSRLPMLVRRTAAWVAGQRAAVGAPAPTGTGHVPGRGPDLRRRIRRATGASQNLVSAGVLPGARVMSLPHAVQHARAPRAAPRAPQDLGAGLPGGVASPPRSGLRPGAGPDLVREGRFQTNIHRGVWREVWKKYSFWLTDTSPGHLSESRLNQTLSLQTLGKFSTLSPGEPWLE